MLGAAADDLVYEETDALFNLGVERTRSRRYLLATSASFTTTEVRYHVAAETVAPWTLILPREQDHEYHVEHRMGEGADSSSTSGPTAAAGGTSASSPRPGGTAPGKVDGAASRTATT